MSIRSPQPDQLNVHQTGPGSTRLNDALVGDNLSLDGGGGVGKRDGDVGFLVAFGVFSFAILSLFIVGSVILIVVFGAGLLFFVVTVIIIVGIFSLTCSFFVIFIFFISGIAIFIFIVIIIVHFWQIVAVVFGYIIVFFVFVLIV